MSFVIVGTSGRSIDGTIIHTVSKSLSPHYHTMAKQPTRRRVLGMLTGGAGIALVGCLAERERES